MDATIEAGAPDGEHLASDTAGTGNARPAGSDPDATDPSLADVDSLFARIRAGHAEAAIEPGAAAPPESGPDDTVAEPSGSAGPEPAVSTAATETAATEIAAADTEAPGTNGTGAPAEAAVAKVPVFVVSSALDAWRSQRSAALDPLLLSLAKRAKRAAQDNQNALLDAVRRHKGRPTAAQVLTPEADVLTAWAEVLKEATDEAYGAGRVAAGGEAARADETLTAGGRCNNCVTRRASASHRRSTPARTATPAGSSNGSAPDSGSGRTSRSKSRCSMR